MLVKPIVFEDIGLLETSYFAYYEDTDLCVRVKSADTTCYASNRQQFGTRVQNLLKLIDTDCIMVLEI